jgi:hypothetical protein
MTAARKAEVGFCSLFAAFKFIKLSQACVSGAGSSVRRKIVADNLAIFHDEAELF